MKRSSGIRGARAASLLLCCCCCCFWGAPQLTGGAPLGFYPYPEGPTTGPLGGLGALGPFESLRAAASESAAAESEYYYSEAAAAAAAAEAEGPRSSAAAPADSSSSKEALEQMVKAVPLRGLKTLLLGVGLGLLLLLVSSSSSKDPRTGEELLLQEKLAELNRVANGALPPLLRLDWAAAISLLSVFFAAAGALELLLSLYRKQLVRRRGAPLGPLPLRGFLLLGLALLVALRGPSAAAADSLQQRNRDANTAAAVALAAAAVGLMQFLSSLQQQRAAAAKPAAAAAASRAAAAAALAAAAPAAPGAAAAAAADLPQAPDFPLRPPKYF
ncbi:hypothetical protein, conserved [Eimeria tenella]|uniref:Uncharacterized protein n=1 Tax=Eimeria tenella TaxID=5802 RepID=U6L683_EIMTE|nr:hypothetical protein, conserved [Eimeria tenella]CDJ44089.1 hypothetical protein, conserved [Eimeria tenella]|eukprot:XP_013234838.1 hypothetical protein, conserved [Eimeria tenella]